MLSRPLDQSNLCQRFEPSLACHAEASEGRSLVAAQFDLRPLISD
jgi:hypothetical protein